jgi:flagellar assembly factor FliW
VTVDGSTGHVPPEQSMSAAVVPAGIAPSVRAVASHVLGDLEVTSDQLLTVPEGLHGFPEHKEFALLPAAREGFWWLQATDEPGLAFLLTDPFRCAPGYELDLSEGDEQFLGLTSPDDALVLTIVTLPASDGGAITTNLRGPIVCNVVNRSARQLVSRNDQHGFAAPVTL